jgi:lysophospholipase L1-like esterase
MGDHVEFNVAFFGTSIMEHLEAYSAHLAGPYDLPPIGSSVIVEEHRKRGWVHALYLRLQAALPPIRFVFDNRGLGGATSRDVLQIVEHAATTSPGPDLAILGVGINDVWRCFEGRPELAVHPDEYRKNYQVILDILQTWATRVICVSETPFGWHETLDVDPMNRQLAAYNTIAAETADEHGVETIDLWTALKTAAEQLPPEASPWVDGAHLSPIGDQVIARTVETRTRELALLHQRP